MWIIKQISVRLGWLPLKLRVLIIYIHVNINDINVEDYYSIIIFEYLKFT